MKRLGRRPALSPPSALAVVIQLDDLLHRGAQPDLPRLRGIYHTVFTAMPRPQPSYHARTTPYWQLGWRYAALLEETNDLQAATQLRSTLDSLVLPAPAPVN